MLGALQWKHSRVISACSVAVHREKSLPSGTAVPRTSSAGSLPHQLPDTSEKISSLEEHKVGGQRCPFPAAVMLDAVCNDEAWTVTTSCAIHSPDFTSSCFSLTGGLLSKHRKQGSSSGRRIYFRCYSVQRHSNFMTALKTTREHNGAKEGDLTFHMLSALGIALCPLLPLIFPSCLSL